MAFWFLLLESARDIECDPARLTLMFKAQGLGKVKYMTLQKTFFLFKVHSQSIICLTSKYLLDGDPFI